MRRALFLSWLVGLGFVTLWPGAQASALGAVRADFNGDGRDDLAVGVPSESVGADSEAGAVNVLYGRAAGLSANGNQFWRQNSPGILGTSEAGDNFGYALAAGDFNGDGSGDLAVGVPIERVDGASNAGAVNILYGGPGGLSATGNQLWSQNSPDVLDAAEAHDGFGSVLTTGDLNGDGIDDLAVGVVNEKLGTSGDAGAVNILYGDVGGLSATGNQFWHQDSPGILNTAEPLDRFASALAAGDLNGDGRDDLAVGVPYEDLSGGDAGAVNVLYGGAGGLSATGNQLWDQDSAGVAGVGQAGDRFGFALAVGDLKGDGNDDLAAGVPGENVAGAGDGGAMNVLYGGAGGLSATGNQFWHQNSAGVADAAEANDDFGSALAKGDFNGDGRDDVAVGVPFEDVATGGDDAGAVNVLYGGATGLSATGNRLWDQDSAGIVDSAEPNDGFGSALGTGDFKGDGRDDLAVGVPFEDVATGDDAGVVNVLYGGAGGLSATGNQRWYQDNAGVVDDAESFDNFGLALAAGDGL